MTGPITKIKEHVFYGRKYKFSLKDPTKGRSAEDIADLKARNGLEPEDQIIALTDNRCVKAPKMIINPKIAEDGEFEVLRVICDESLHALDEKLDNDCVDEMARDLANFLWRCGYRRITE